MKTLQHILIIIFLFSGIYPTSGQDQLKGKVKSYSQTGYNVVHEMGELKRGEKIVDESCQNLFVLFDINGNETENTEYKFDGSVMNRTITKRDVKGNVIEEIHLNYTDNYKYNGKGQILEKITTYSDGDIRTMKYKYDRRGNYTVYNPGGSINSKKIFNNGHKIEESLYDNEIICFRYKFDQHDNIIECSYYKADGSLDFINTTIRKYDLNGNEIENINGTATVTAKYSLDTNGNWIRRIVYENGEPRDWTERTIEYYP